MLSFRGLRQCLPNALSVVRMALAPVVISIIQADGFGSYRFLTVLGIAMVTDWMDGWLARLWNVESESGKLLDPLADKIFLGALFIALGVRGIVPLWLVGALISRDIVILIGAMIWKFLSPQGRKIPSPLWIGKLHTAIIAALAFFASLARTLPSPFWSSFFSSLEGAFLFFALLSTLLSGAAYARKFWNYFR